MFSSGVSSGEYEGRKNEMKPALVFALVFRLHRSVGRVAAQHHPYLFVGAPLCISLSINWPICGAFTPSRDECMQ